MREMVKKSSIVKVVALSIVLLFITSGFSIVFYGPPASHYNENYNFKTKGRGINLNVNTSPNSKNSINKPIYMFSNDNNTNGFNTYNSLNSKYNKSNNYTAGSLLPRYYTSTEGSVINSYNQTENGAVANDSSGNSVYEPKNGSNYQDRFSSLTNSHLKYLGQYNNTYLSVHLFVNGNGYVVFSANYTVGGILTFNYTNDKTKNFTTNDVPSGTIFHLVASANDGYVFQEWIGSVNSTNNSIYITVNDNISEEAIYVMAPSFPVTFTESGLPTGTIWYANISNGNNSGAISESSYTFYLTNGTYSYQVGTSDKTFSPSPHLVHLQ